MLVNQTTYVLFISQEDSGNDGRLQRVVERGHEIIHAVIVPETAQVSHHELDLTVADEHQHKATDGEEPQQETHELTIQTLQVGRGLVLLYWTITLAKVQAGRDQARHAQLEH